MTIEPLVQCTDAVHVGERTGKKERYMEGVLNMDIPSGRWSLRIPAMGIDEMYRPDDGYKPRISGSAADLKDYKSAAMWIEKIQATVR